MPAITTQELRVQNSDLFAKLVTENSTYVAISRTTSWTDDTNPPDIVDSVEEIIESYDELVGMKKVTSGNVLSVVPRINWTTGVVYSQYDSSVDMINEKTLTGDYIKFYVMTDEYNVYKCLFNNNDTASTVKPTGSGVTAFTTTDGYIWKYMYTIKSTDTASFLTNTWMPCYTLFANDGSSQWLVQQATVPGAIDVVLMEDSGANFTGEPTVTITGDGVGATARAVIDGTGKVSKVYIVTPGSGYTTATVSIVGTGTGATARAVISPVNGHGSDARVELGGTYKMIRLIFDSDEGGKISTDTTYRHASIIINPLSTVKGTIVMLSDVKLFASAETLTGAASGASGTIAAVDTTRNWLYVINVVGSFLNSESVSSQTYNASSVIGVQTNKNVPLTVSAAGPTEVVTNSGSIIYMSKREPITRHSDQIEEARYVVAF